MQTPFAEALSPLDPFSSSSTINFWWHHPPNPTITIGTSTPHSPKSCQKQQLFKLQKSRCGIFQKSTTFLHHSNADDSLFWKYKSLQRTWQSWEVRTSLPFFTSSLRPETLGDLSSLSLHWQQISVVSSIKVNCQAAGSLSTQFILDLRHNGVDKKPEWGFFFSFLHYEDHYRHCKHHFNSEPLNSVSHTQILDFTPFPPNLLEEPK